MPASDNALRPLALAKEEPDRLKIRWSDGHESTYAWRHLRDHCPCASCREESSKQQDPFHILTERELTRQPLAPVAMTPVGHYAYKITWNDGHDSGIFTLENLRELCQCSQCQPARRKT
jgi:DUF971 family protein